ncbi:acetyl-CoA hydrolase/transferase family protein [Ramlibacter alkalitolerans]|uniref:Acetyl-CoA hydrolase n=1 Tax=Ramlibacter alkalitolerans TaxID=2039631 RepID=A0ABS1JM19_9BURK|nr:acetyl-CoA hydrolase/transferase C-terminal domain-containing protein [Ramlibacter alkalitolerans]MBL0425277.1 acetyl-CoA hydrolase [Ramlibacter alkalitolerans]
MKPLQDPGALFASLPAGATIVLHSGFAEPRGLARALAQHAGAMRRPRVVAMMPMGHAPYADPEPASHLELYTFFPGKGLRAALDAGRARALRHPLSAIPPLFDAGEWRADVLLLQVSPPDATGHVSLGVSVDYMRAVLAQRPLVVAEVNPRMPRTTGDTLLAASAIDWCMDATEPPQDLAPAAADAVDEQIARNVAGLVRDGAVLQAGIGALPDRVLGSLGHLRHLGLHSGVITSAVRPLIESGAIDNSSKRLKPGVCVTAMAGGTQAFYDFLHRNAAIEFHPCSLTHDARVLAAMDGLCAINSVLQVDLQGSANAETAGGRRISLPGGLPDFATGARRARGGVSILALRSTAGRAAASSIVARLDGPATVVADQVDFVVTEHGVAALHGGTAAARAAALVAVAHPAHRDALARAAHA